jgi:mercuric ion binding protein
MFSAIKLLVVGVAGAAILCPLCESRFATAANPGALLAASVSAVDTATTRLHISGMTCGTCPTTARIALTRVPGVFSAKVTLDDSLGVVKYDPSRVNAKLIAAQLTKVTGYGARILSDSVSRSTPSRGA